MNRAKIGTKGQVVIPASLRRQYHLKPGTEVVFSADGRDLSLKPITAERIDSLFGILKGEEGEEKLTDVLVRERRKDLEMEEKKFARFFRKK